MQARWLLSVVCLVVLGVALVANAQTTPGSSDPPQNFTIVRVVGSASDAASTLNSSSVNSLNNNVNNFGSQAQIWFAFWYPQNLGNDPNSAVRDYGVTISPSTNVSAQTCLQITGSVCATAGTASASAITTSNSLYAIHWFDQQIVEGTAYTLAAYSVSNFGAGVTGSSQTQTIPYSGNPIKPSTPTFTFVTPTSFVVNFVPPQYIGQRGAGPNTGGGNNYVLTGAFHEVQIRYPALSTADTAYPNWYPVTIAGGQFSSGSVSTASVNNQAALVEIYTSSTTQYLVANASYQVRVRSIGQWGKGVWSAAGSVTTANTKSTPNAITFVPKAMTTMAAGGLFYWSSAMAAPTAQTTKGFYGTVGGKGGNVSGAAIQSYSVQFSVDSIGSNGTAVTALTSYYTWNSVSDTVNVQRQQGRVVGGWVNITSASIPTALTTYTVANAGTNIYLRVVAANDNGSGTLPSSSTWYNADIQATAAADITITIISCWGVPGTATKSSCNFTFPPAAGVGKAVTFSGYGWSAGTDPNAFATPTPALPTSLGPTTMRWDFGFDNNYQGTPGAVTAYADYGVFTTTAGFCTTAAQTNVNPKLTQTFTDSGSNTATTRINGAATDFATIAVTVTSSTSCGTKFADAATFQTRNPATGNTTGSMMGKASAGNGQDEILAVGVDWVMLWVNRPQKAGTNATTAGAVTGWTLRAATGTTDILAANAVASAYQYFTGFNSSGSYGSSSSTSITTDLSFVVAAQFAASSFDATVTKALTTQFHAIAGANVVVSTAAGNAVGAGWTIANAANVVTGLSSTTGLAVGMRLASSLAGFPVDGTNGVYIGAITANTSFTVVKNDGTTAANSTALIAAAPGNVLVAYSAVNFVSTSAYTANSIFTGALAANTVGIPATMAVNDVSDYSATLTFVFQNAVGQAGVSTQRGTALGGSWNSGIPAMSFSFSTANFQVPVGTNVAITSPTCTSIDSTQSIGAQLLYNCQMPLTMPGRSYNIAAKMVVGGTTADTATNTVAFIAGSERPTNPGTSSPVSGTSTPKNSYYYATATGFTLFRSVQYTPSIGEGGYNSRAVGAAPWPGYVAWLNPTANASTSVTAQRDEAGTATVTQLGAGWHSLAFTQWKGINFNTGAAAATNGVATYSLNVSITTDINQAVPPASISVTTGSTAASTYATAPTMITTTSNLRRMTTTTAWIEYEAPATRNGSNAGWVFTATCGSGAAFNPTGTAAVTITPGGTDSASLNVNFGLQVLDFTAGNAGSSCSTTVALGDATTKGAVSGSVTIQLSKLTAPAAPGTPYFDQITSGSTVIVIPYPVDFGNAATIQALATTNVVVTLTSGTTNTGNAIYDAGSIGTTSTVYQDYNSYVSGAAARVTGFTQVTSGVSTSVNIAANSAYSVSVTLQNGSGASAVSPATTGSFTSARNGDIPLAPTVTAVSRITSSSVRLTVTRPINVGGSPLAGIFGSSSTQVFRAWGFENGSGVTGISPLTITITTPVLPLYTPTQANVVSYLVDVTGGITLTTSGRNYVFYVNADNQFSTSVTGNYVIGSIPNTSGTCNNAAGNCVPINLSTATVATAMPASTAVCPSAALSPVITSYSDTAISIGYAENAMWGSTAVTGYKISRRTGGTGAYTSLATQTGLSFQDTALTAGTAYDYNVVATSSTCDATTAANVGITTLATNAAPGAPAAPQLLQFADSMIRIYWPQPIALGGLQGTLAAPQLAGYRLTATWASSVQAEVCDTVYSWVGATATTTGISATADLNGNSYFYYTASAIPGKSYSYKVLALNIITPTGGSPTTQLGANSSSVTQLANSIVRPYPLPSVTSNTIGAGYVTFTVGTTPACYSGSSITTAIPTCSSTGTSVSVPNGINSAFLGYQVLQMSPNTNQTGSTFVADRIWDFTSYGSFGAGGASSSLYANELTANSKYRFKVQYTNGFQTAVQAQDITVTTATTAVVPGTVNSVVSNVLAKRSNSISLSWVSPLETGGRGALSSFRVTYVASSSTNTQVNTTAPVIAYNAFGFRQFGMVLGGLSAATQYTIQVYGINSVGTSTTASSFLGTPDATNGLNNVVLTGQVPNLPTNLAVVTNNNTPKLTLSWTTSVAGSTVTTSQQFNIQTTSDNVAAASAAISAITTSQTDVTGVVAGGLYRFQLSSTNSIGTSERSQALFVQVQPTTSTTAAPIPSQIGVPTLTGYSSDEYRLSWSADSAVTTAFNVANPTVNPGAAYTVAYWRVYNRFIATSTVPIVNEGDSLQTQMVGPGSSTSGASPSVLGTCTQLVYTILPSTQYMVTVAGKNSSVNWGSFSAFGFNTAGNAVGFKPQMTQPATAGAPQNLQLQSSSSITTTTFAVQWNTPTWIGQSGITQYRVTVSAEFGSRLIVTNVVNPNAPVNTQRAAADAAVTYTATGLQPGTNYIMNIRAVNSFGPSIPSQNLRVTTIKSSGFAAQTSFWTVVLMALAAVLAFAF